MSYSIKIDVARGDSISPPRHLFLFFLLSAFDLRLPLGFEIYRFLKGILCAALMRVGLLVLFDRSNFVL